MAHVDPRLALVVSVSTKANDAVYVMLNAGSTLQGDRGSVP
jgi:hypothetical protein